MSNIPINSGTGPGVAVDLVGSDNFQVVKLMLAASGASTAYATVIPISGTISANVLGTPSVSISNTPSVTVANSPVVTVSNTVTVTGTIGAITTILGTVAVSGGGGGTQYSAGDTSMGSTGTGTIALGVQTGATTGRALAVTTTGAQFVTFAGVQSVTAANVTVASVTTGTVNIGQVYSVGATTMALTGTGVMVIGVQTGATTGRALALTTSGQQLMQISTGTVSIDAIAGTVTVTGTSTAVQGGTWNIATVSTVLGVVAVSGGGGGVQYGAGTTGMGSTATGTVVIGIQSGATTGRALLLSTTGGLIIDSMPAVGGGQQYSAGNTNMGATATGTIILGVQSGATTGRALTIDTTGGLIIASMPSVGGGQQYSAGTTNPGATGTGTLALGIQSGSTAAQAFAVSTTGAQYVVFAGTQAVTAAGVTVASITTGTVNVVNVLSASGVTVASLTTGTVNVVNVLSASGVTIGNITGSAIYSVAGTALGTTGQGILAMAIQSGSTAAQPFAVTTTGAQYVLFTATQAVTAANVTIASITTGTMNVVNVLSASGVTIASMATGTVNVVNTVAISGSVTPIGTGNMVLVQTASGLAGGITMTGHASRWQSGVVIATTSAAAGVIIKTSGANTLYITDLLISVSGPMDVQICSETTAMGRVYLSANGGFVQDFTQPWICTSAQSLRVILSSSGTCAVTAVGYTVT